MSIIVKGFGSSGPSLIVKGFSGGYGLIIIKVIHAFSRILNILELKSMKG